MKKITVIATFSACVLCVACGVSNKAVKRMQLMEEGVSSPTTIEEYEAAIKKYERRIADITLAQQQVGIWYKIVGARYLDNNMFGEALKAYQAAIQYFPDNQNLYYYVGLCAGYLSHTALDYDATGDAGVKRYNYLKLSEQAYLRAIAIEPRYVRALYGLGVLYVHELDESSKAIPILETLLTVDTGHIDAMFVLAHAYYDAAEYDKAIALYDRIIARTKNAERKATAEANRAMVAREAATDIF
ncbi:MAG: tetratricopeptide repeat protein [Treponema sp.]|nr:tetratricopeptide repeat protein [Treponema sp.]